MMRQYSEACVCAPLTCMIWPSLQCNRTLQYLRFVPVSVHFQKDRQFSTSRSLMKRYPLISKFVKKYYNSKSWSGLIPLLIMCTYRRFTDYTDYFTNVILMTLHNMLWTVFMITEWVTSYLYEYFDGDPFTHNPFATIFCYNYLSCSHWLPLKNFIWLFQC